MYLGTSKHELVPAVTTRYQAAKMSSKDQKARKKRKTPSIAYSIIAVDPENGHPQRIDF
jgi:hypothetical protein